jgi:hypothetical protein
VKLRLRTEHLVGDRFPAGVATAISAIRAGVVVPRNVRYDFSVLALGVRPTRARRVAV